MKENDIIEHIRYGKGILQEYGDKVSYVIFLNDKRYRRVYTKCIKKQDTNINVFFIDI